MNTFVWFDLKTNDLPSAKKFYKELLGWEANDVPGGEMAMLAGANGPWAGISKSTSKNSTGWIPYAQVENVDSSTRQAQTLGAKLLQEKTKGPAGSFSVVQDPAGGIVALWQKG